MSDLILFEKYSILKTISRSKYSTVYFVQHVRLQCFRIIKKIYKSSPCYSWLIGEARIMKRLKHPCIPQIYDIEEDDSAFYIVEQYMEGESLKSICQKQNLQEKTILSYAIQICDLIHYLHSGQEPIFYLDLKPENILVHDGQIYLVDFGSAYEEATGEEQTALFGTPWFAAPEQYMLQKVDERADIYGIGMLLYYMVLGKQYTSEKGKNIDFSNTCSKELKHIINRCVKMQAFGRYDSVSELQKKLSSVHTKRMDNKSSNNIISIAIAGSSCRIGVSHVALQFASHLNNKKHPCLYLECNDSLALSAMARRQPSSCYKEDGFLLHNIPCKIYEEHMDMQFDSKYQYVIFDYGILTANNYLAFLKADHSILMMGAKEWELDAAENSIELCDKNKQIHYAFNFISAMDFKTVQRNMQGRKCYRVPYEPQLFLWDKNSMSFAFFTELLQEFQKKRSKVMNYLSKDK